MIRMEGCNAGFTMIELIVAVCILGIMTAAIVPFAFEEMAKKDLERAARMIAGDIRFGESKALAEQSNAFKIHFVPANNEYLTYFDTANPSRCNRVKLPERVTMSSAVFGSESTRVNFNLKGSVNVGGSVALTDNYGNWIFVRVAPVTGRVRLERIKK